MIEFLKAGLLTTIQDSGRYNYQRFGVPVAGAMDEFALYISNILAGNPKEAAVLEITILGPTIKFHTTNIFAISGGAFEARLNDEWIIPHKAYKAEAGSILKIGAALKGCRGYIAFAGGIGGQTIMKSKSTYMKGSIGGIKGRAIKEGDVLGFLDPKEEISNLTHRFITPYHGLEHLDSPVLKVIMGPQDNCFSQKGQDTFLSETYTITPENDRMGYRLEGPSIAYQEGIDGNIISDGIAFGAVQVPSGQPIIMMADRQTTGGYAKIASVIRVDLPHVAQLKTGDKIRFKKVTVQEAQLLYRHKMQYLDHLEQHLNHDEIKSRTCYSIGVKDSVFDVTVSEIN
ncbi:biotin-dependent carboxyltransferase family protein [Cellulosilyticum sp. I15G10I2]|uniref:5-oxoprolinase subunit C family protein n=1 Tax=Cellulosilyticum sp. I15G10I2 TaxID=1892843 RepID=UPI00085BEFE7|nr:biotin-dependent carboxyltransferase family protein [Cellulosilyticum sp. I15G10I2]